MCGVAGIYAYHYAANPVDRDELARIRDRMASRGPDGAADWLDAGGRVGLGHRRLAVIDLSPAAAGPMASHDGALVVSFNGEIYNYRELRARLEGEGARFRTQSDTEVLLELYRSRGTGMFAELRGMYAFVLWDAAKQALLLARDPYGIKPLYYADDGWTLRAASQVKALLAGRVDRSRDPAGVTGFYLWGHVPEPFTLYRGIRALPAGHFLWVDRLGAGAPQPHASIAAALADAAPARGDAASAVREALLESVRYHLVADVPVGVFLSAGVDSGTLLALMRESGYPDVHAITLAFDEFSGTELDEAPLAARVAAHYGARHTVRRVSFEEFAADLPRILEAMDQPTIDGINSWFVAKAAREQGLKVALSGLGGDELFGGYPSFRTIPGWVRWMAVPSRIPGLRAASEWLLRPLAPRTAPKLPGIVRYGGSYAGAYFLKRGLFLPSELRGVLSREVLEEGLRRLERARPVQAALAPDPGNPHARVAALESQLYMRNQLLRDTDWAAMAHSVEVRTPLVDYALLRSLAPWIRSGAVSGKAVLAAVAQPPLPGALLARSKTGFTTPIDRWLRRVVRREATPAPWARTWAGEVLRGFGATA
ncbi:MAG: asparagine synthase (glutamine-hydrolyzing) [Gammaproteobacteria bacterium]